MMELAYTTKDYAGRSSSAAPPFAFDGSMAGEQDEIVHREPAWRRPSILDEVNTQEMGVVASSWSDPDFTTPEASTNTAASYYTAAIVLKRGQLTMSVDGKTTFSGRVGPGMLQIGCPGETIRGVFHGPAEFLHIHVPERLLAECQETLGLGGSDKDIALKDPCFALDTKIDQLGRALLAMKASGPIARLYVDGIGLAIVARLLETHSNRCRPTPPTRVAPLQTWRLKRAIAHIDDNLGETISLQDLAGAVGLTRMHFAAQFRAATGLRPHEYVLRRRIDRAQDLLATGKIPLVEVALETGFQTQAHFTTVFKRFAGDTPYRWRQAHCLGA